MDRNVRKRRKKFVFAFRNFVSVYVHTCVRVYVFTCVRDFLCT